MSDDYGFIFSLLDKIDIILDDDIISKEKIIRHYFNFLADKFVPGNRSVSVCLHTGDIAFRATTIASVFVAYLISVKFNTSQKTRSFAVGDIVIHDGKTWICQGIENGNIRLEKDGRGDNGPCKTIIDTDHIGNIQRYHGSSTGVRQRRSYKSSTKSEFISFLLGHDSDVKRSSSNFSIIILSSRKAFEEIYSRLNIRYDNKTVRFTEIISAAYYTEKMKSYQIGSNSEKSEPVIKVTDSMRGCIKIINDRDSDNEVCGMFITDPSIMSSCSGDLESIHDNTFYPLRFFFITVPFSVFACNLLEKINFLDGMDSSSFFFCTADYLKIKDLYSPVFLSNGCTESLKQHISNIISKDIHVVHVDNYWNGRVINDVRRKIYKIGNQEWARENNFFRSSFHLYRLFESSFFGFREYDGADRMINDLRTIVKESTNSPKECNDVLNFFDEVYEGFHDSTPKGEALLRVLKEHSYEKTALIVPKRYFVNIFQSMYGECFKNVSCIYFKKFDATCNYDLIISLKDHNDKDNLMEFDVFQCCSTPKFIIILYDFEVELYLKRKVQNQKMENYLNYVAGLTADIQELERDEGLNYVSERDNTILKQHEVQNEDFDPDDATMEKLLNSLDTESSFVKFRHNNFNYTGNVEISRIGYLSNGAIILFSKNYKAVVFERDSNKIAEVYVHEINEGDELIFVKNDTYAKNMVDFIFEKLKEEHLLDNDINRAKEQAEQWRTALHKYHKSHKSYNYADIAYYLTKLSPKNNKKYNSQIIRQWLVDDSNIIGPQKDDDYLTIAKLTQDPELSQNYKGCCEACKKVRSFRRKIREFMKEAIASGYGNKDISDDDTQIVKMIHDNLQNLSEIAELVKITDIPEECYVNIGKANRLIYDSEELSYE